MTRPPKAKLRILDAARRIVEERGAGHLTFDELARESGVTRGGITYHFPTKEDLLRGLIEADMQQWESASATPDRLPPGCECPRTAVVLGQLRCHLSEDDRNRRFVHGMLSAAMVDQSLLDPIRAHLKAEFVEWTWDEADLRRYLLLAAAEGLFWQDMFNLNPVPAAARGPIRALIERLLLEWAADANPVAPVEMPPMPDDHSGSAP